jgi:hypothetical protein
MTDPIRALALPLLLGSTLALACSSGTDKGNGGIGGAHKCGEVLPCGGDIVGNWAVSDACIDPTQADTSQLDMVKQTCSAFTYTTGIDVSGTADFTATTYDVNLDAKAIVTMHFPKSCLTGVTCSAIEQLFASYFGGNDSSFSCTGSSDCNCTLTQSAPQMESGTYTTSGTEVTMTPDGGGAASSSPYCVQGSTLHIVTLDSNDSTKIAADIVGTK